jgi:DNA-binding winged helix-turn-helix (wHTH) protein
MEFPSDQGTWRHPDGRTVRLRPMEARLLAYLRASGGQVLGIRELLRNVWGYNASVRSRTVYTTVNRLRAAIEPEPHRPRWIVTVPGGGFRWMGDSAAEARETARPNLPPQLDSFVDRPEVAAAVESLAAGHRLVTLTGLGGMGKTRTAFKVAEAMAHAFVGGIEIVDLTRCGDEESLHRRFATELGVPIPVLDEAGALLRRALALRAGTLVVLDNAEQVSASLATLLRGALRDLSGASLLVTSRKPLGVRGEMIVRVGPLSVEPPLDGGMSPAAALFRDRVSTVGVVPNTEDVEGIVTQLDGIPLAIEFAAARARTLPAEELGRRLAAGIALTRPTDSDVRHASLDAALEQTWLELGRPLQEAVASLVVLDGWFSFGLADAVMPSDHPIADVLERLVVHGMLQFDGTHYRLLTPVADFVGRRVPDAREGAWERLDQHLARLPLGKIWERRFSARLALDNAAHHLPAAWVRAWNRAHAADARALLQRTFAVHRMLGQPETEPALADEVITTAEPAERAQLVLERANLCTSAVLCQLGEALEWASAALDPWTEAYAHAYRGLLTQFSETDDVRALTPDESTPAPLAIFLAIARYYHHVDGGLGSAEERLSEIEAAVALSQLALDPDLEVHHQLLLAHAHALDQCGRYPEAVSAIERLESWRSRIGEVVGRFGGVWPRVTLLCAGGRLERAESLVRESSREARRSASVLFMARVAHAAARVKAECGEAHAAILLSQEAARGFAENGNHPERGAALRERANIEIQFDRADLARSTLMQAREAAVGSHHVFWCDALLLECDLRAEFESVDESRVADLVARAATRGAHAQSVMRALHAWWLAGNGDPSRAGATLAHAWAGLGPAHGIRREGVARIARIVEALAPPGQKRSGVATAGWSRKPVSMKPASLRTSGR